jgi:hypothetical protein
MANDAASRLAELERRGGRPPIGRSSKPPSPRRGRRRRIRWCPHDSRAHAPKSATCTPNGSDSSPRTCASWSRLLRRPARPLAPTCSTRPGSSWMSIVGARRQQERSRSSPGGRSRPPVGHLAVHERRAGRPRALSPAPGGRTGAGTEALSGRAAALQRAGGGGGAGMSDEPEILFRNPSRMFEDGARAKQAHRQYLAEIFAGAYASEAEADAAIDDAAYERFRRPGRRRRPPQARGAELMDEAALVALLTRRAKATKPVTKPTSSGGFDGGCRPARWLLARLRADEPEPSAASPAAPTRPSRKASASSTAASEADRGGRYASRCSSTPSAAASSAAPSASRSRCTTSARSQAAGRSWRRSTS